MKNKVIFLIIYFFFIGCASKTIGPYGPNYYYGGYLYNLDNYKKNLTPESEEQLINALHNIISKSKEYDADRNTEIKDWRVPPGICAELGYRLAKQGNFEDADALYNLELKFYPESIVLIEKLKIQLQDTSSN